MCTRLPAPAPHTRFPQTPSSLPLTLPLTLPLPLPLPLQAKLCNLLVSGSKDGSLVLVDISSGRVVAAAERAHASQRTGLPGLLAAASAAAAGGPKPVDRSVARRSRPPNAAGVAVGGLACLPDAGVVSCGADGVVRYHPLAPQLLDLRGR